MRRSERLDRFCPTCRRRRGRDADLCPECGDRTHARGYCPVCERHLDAPEGDLCPKHETPLEDGPAERPSLSVDATDSWVTIRQFRFNSLAIAPRCKLESEGIPTFLDGERVASEVAYTLATGGVRLQVPGSFVDRAREVLGITEPLPTTRNRDWRRPLIGMAVAVAMLLGTGILTRWLVGS